MKLEVRLLLFVLVACAAFVMLGDGVDAAGHDLDLELNDTSNVKVAHGRLPERFNWTLTYNGSAASESIVIDVIDAHPDWVNLVLSTNVTFFPRPFSHAIDVLVRKGETIDVDLTITPPYIQLNDTYWFTLISYPEADPTYNVTYEVGVVLPQEAGFHLEVWNPPPNSTFQAIPPSTVTIRFALYNTGNGVDRFLIMGSSSRSDDGWTLAFEHGIDEYGYTDELQGDPLMKRPYFIDVKVPIPAGTDANVEAIVTLNATSMFNTSIEHPPAVVTIRALQYFNYRVYISGPDAKEGMPGENVTFQFKISNRANGPDTYSFRAILDGELNPGFVAFVYPSSITVEANDTVTAVLVVEVPEDAPKKTYFFTLEVRSTSPELAPVTKSFSVEVGQFFGVELTCEDTWRVTDLGGNLEFEVTVKNTGNGLDPIVITDIEGAPRGWLTYTQPPKVTLLQDQEARIKVIIIIPSQVKEAQLMNYTLTVRGVSSRGDAEGTVNLFIDIRQFWRIEWTHRGEDITNPIKPQAQAGSIRPRPEIDLFDETSTTIVLGVRSYGNGPDGVTVEVDNGFDQVDIAVSPTSFSLESAVTQDITVTITVPMGHRSGSYYFLLKASSSNGSVAVRSVPIDFLLMPVFIEEDFDDMENITDDVGDDYLFTFTLDEAGGEVLESSGRHHRSSNIDIVSISVVHDHSAGKVNVTLVCAGEIVIEEGTEYWVFFVNGSHRQPQTLLNPWDYSKGSLTWTFSDQSTTLSAMYYTNGVMGTSFDVTGLRVEIEGERIMFTVCSRDLRAAGVAPVSGFGIYAYAHTMTIREDGDYRVRVDWDAAGTGAARVPAEFFIEREEESPVPPFLAPLAMVMVAVAVLALSGRRGRES